MNTVELAKKLLEYCEKNPEQRVWQAVRNFTGWKFVYVGDGRLKKDSFYVGNEDVIPAKHSESDMAVSDVDYQNT